MVKIIAMIIGVLISFVGLVMLFAFFFYDSLDLSQSQEYYGIVTILAWLWANQIERSISA